MYVFFLCSVGYHRKNINEIFRLCLVTPPATVQPSHTLCAPRKRSKGISNACSFAHHKNEVSASKQENEMKPSQTNAFVSRSDIVNIKKKPGEKERLIFLFVNLITYSVAPK